MAWGLWNKIKNGFKKAGQWIKGAAEKIRDKVIKPVTEKVIKPFKPLISAAVTAYNPQAGAAVDTALGVVEKLSDEGWGSAAKDVAGLAQGAGGFTPFKRLR